MIPTMTAQPGSAAGQRHRLFTAALFAVIGASAAAPGSAPRVAAPGGPATPLRGVTITLALEAHARRGEMAANRVTTSKRAKVGEPFAQTVGAGTIENRDICAVAATLEPLYMTWRVQTTVRSADSERIEIDLAWQRTTAGSGTAAEGRAVVAVAPGRSHLIDVVATNPEEERMCSHVTLRLTAGRMNPVSGGLFVHRLWLVQEQGATRAVSEPVEAIGNAGEQVAFRFRPLRWNLAGVPVTGAPGPLVDVDVLGTVASETLEDGTIETTVDVKRVIRFGPFSFSGGGTLVMTSRAGEAGEVEIPSGGGLGRLPAENIPSGPLARGVTRQGNDIRFDFSQFFAGTRRALVVAVEPLR